MTSPLVESLWLPATTLCLFAVMAWLPGRWLLTPFTGGFHGAMRESAALLVGWSAYTLVADATLKLFSPVVGFYAAPLVVIWALAWLARSAGDHTPPGEAFPSLGITRNQAVFACLLGVVGVLQVIPVELDGGVYWGTPEIDWRSRIPVINAIARDGLPANNPFFSPDGTSKLFFYYGFFLLPAACVHPTLHLPMVYGTALVLAICAFLVGTMVAQWAMTLGNAAVSDQRGGWVSGALCYVMGLDLLPVLSLTLRGEAPSSIEWWNPAQISAITAIPVWVPHHTLATLQVILAHVLAWRLEALPTGRSRWSGGAVLVVVLAGAAMTSTYVAMLGFVSIALHGSVQVVRHRDWRVGGWPIAAAILAGVVVLPFYAHLATLDENGAAALRPALRPSPSEDLISVAIAQKLEVSEPVALLITRAVGLVPQYFGELGLLFLVLVAWWRNGVGARDPSGLWNRLGVMVAVAFGIGSILVSVRTWNPDLNWRIMHPVQVALLGAAAAFWRDFRARPRPIVDSLGVAAFVAVGVTGTAYDLTRTRWDRLRDPTYGDKGRVAQEASVWLNANAAGDDRISFDPRNFDGPGNEVFTLLLRPQVVVSDESFNAYPYGPHPDRVAAVAADFVEAFSIGTPATTRRGILDRYEVDWVVLDRRSELFGLDAGSVFGDGAYTPEGAAGPGWAVVRLP